MKKAESGLANHRLQPLGHLSTTPSEACRQRALKQILPAHIRRERISDLHFGGSPERLRAHYASTRRDHGMAFQSLAVV
jgi:hypothetical protein